MLLVLQLLLFLAYCLFRVKQMKVLLSPAKAIDISKRINTKVCTEPAFIDEAQGLVNKLAKLSAKKIGSMMKLSKDLSGLNQERYQNWSSESVLNHNNGHVIAIFNGEAYRGFDAETLSAKELDVAQDKVRILSGVYGLLKPLDVISPYRLEMGTSWAITPSKSNLYKFWSTKLADFINAENGDKIIINVASNEYFKAVDKKTLEGRVITPVFKDLKNGEYKTIMVYAKKARGMMARYIVKNNISDPENIKSFNYGGYRYDENLSVEDEWVFTR